MDKKQRILKELELVSSEIKSLNAGKKRLQDELVKIKAKENYTQHQLSKEEVVLSVTDLFASYSKPKLISVQGLKFFCNAGNLGHEDDEIFLKMMWNGINQPIVILSNVPYTITVKHHENHILCEIDNAILMTQHGSVFENDVQ